MRAWSPGARTAFAGPVRHVYVHVPFCRAKCDYCEFFSVPLGGRASGDREAMLDDYVEALTAEWRLERPALGIGRLETLFVGGGTPSLLGPERLETLLRAFDGALTPHAEVSVETNPEDVDAAYAAWAARRGVRVSLGVQSFSAAARRALGRRATADPAAAFAQLRRAGCAEIGLDLIFGGPGQDIAALDDDLERVAALRPEHISYYELGVAPDTPLARALGGEHDAPPAGDEELAEMFRRVVRRLGRAGYDWYEVSNFALPGHRSRHNAAYWRARPYLGLGPGAVSTVGAWPLPDRPGAVSVAGARRWRDTPDLAAWAEALTEGRRPPREVEDLDAPTVARERLLLAARCGLPVGLGELAPVLDTDAAALLADSGLVSLGGGTIRVTRKGRYVANEVCVRLFRDTC